MFLLLTKQTLIPTSEGDDPTTAAPDYETIRDKTSVIYPEIDGSPSKAWIIHHRAEPDVQPLFELGFGKRPVEELYDLRNDPDHMTNLATDGRYQEVRQELSAQLMQVLTDNHDPRVCEDPCRYEHLPYTVEHAG